MILHGFAGPGGWCTGLRMAGYRDLSVGIEKDRAACLTAVTAGHLRIQADVATYPLAHLAGRVTGLVQSPPCPTFSTAGDGAGKVDMPNVYRLIADFAAGRTPGDYEWADERSRLTAEPMRYATALHPRFIALEQVPPVLPLWRYTAELLRKQGYKTWTGVLSAEEFGVPQTRKRAILMASLDGPVQPPAPTHQAYRSGQDAQVEPDLFGDPLPPPVSMAEALGWGLPDRPSWTVSGGGTDTGGAEVFANAGNREKLRQIVLRKQHGAGMIERHGGASPDRSGTDPAFTVTGSDTGGTRIAWALAPAGATSEMVEPRPGSDPAHTITGKGTAAWVVRTGNNSMVAGRAGSRDGDGDVQRYERSVDAPAPTLDTNVGGKWSVRPATTVCGDARIAPPGHRDREGGERQFGADTVRVTVQEAGVLQSFPPDYPWRGTKTAQYRQCGDAVPPLLAMHILRELLALTAEREVAA